MTGHPEREITLAPGERHELTLAGLGTAGYGWSTEVSGDPDVVSVARGRTATDPDRSTGAATDEVVTLTAVGPGTAVVRLSLARPWETDTPPRSTFAVHVTVR